jgi:hypothetical protein
MLMPIKWGRYENLRPAQTVNKFCLAFLAQLADEGFKIIVLENAVPKIYKLFQEYAR